MEGVKRTDTVASEESVKLDPARDARIAALEEENAFLRTELKEMDEGLQQVKSGSAAVPEMSSGGGQCGCSVVSIGSFSKAATLFRGFLHTIRSSHYHPLQILHGAKLRC